MKVGDLVKKVGGNVGIGKSGIIVRVYNTESKHGFPIVEALSEGEFVKWPAHLLEVIHENRR